MVKIKHKYMGVSIRLMLLVAFMSIFGSIETLEAQKPQFSQFYASPLYLAPSFAGASDGSRITLNYRDQWPSFPGRFTSFAFGFDHYFHDYKSGAGLLILSDRAGSANLGTTDAGFLYSYNFNINREWKMRPGLHFLYTERTLDHNKIILGDQLSLENDFILPTSNSSLPDDRIGYFDASASLLAYSRNIWTGISFDHIMTPDQSMTQQKSRIPLKVSLFGGYRYMLSRPLTGIIEESISFTFLYKNQGPFNQLDISGYWTKDPVSLGLVYRGIPIFNNPVYGVFNNDAVALMVALRKDNLRIGYSYDFTISDLMGSTGGAHEISIIFQFNQGPPRKYPGVIPCPVSPYN